MSDWDNIAPIVPKFLRWLEEYFEANSEFCKELNSREHINHLREDMENRFVVARNHTDDLRGKDLEEKRIIKV